MNTKNIELREYTINQYIPDIFADLYRARPDVLCFSCYIWNIEMVKELAERFHQLRPGVPIWYGGPEVSYDAMETLAAQPWLTGIMRGEGEAIFKELAAYYVYHLSPENTGTARKGLPFSAKGMSAPEVSLRGSAKSPMDKAPDLKDIAGIAYRTQDGQLMDRGWRPYLDMDTIPFIYEDTDDLAHKIIYYESSRGCPFACSYCLSSAEKSVRFRSLSLVEKELQFFIDRKVPQVKFVDRTFNCHKGHAMAIWRYIHTHDQGFTNFHFEIGADLLDEEALGLLTQMRPGLVQLEIGVQSTLGITISEVSRTMDLERLSAAVTRINAAHNIHQHLDLIAGLPYEDLPRFRQSFNEVCAMAPDQLQLGFLKVLKGSRMHEKAADYGIIYQKRAPYEVMQTRWMPFEDILHLKDIEEMVEVYYNSHQFDLTLRYLMHFYPQPFDLFEALAAYYAAKGIARVQQSRLQRYDILLDFAAAMQTPPDPEILKGTMICDLYCRDNLKSRPLWAGEHSLHYDACEAFYRHPALTARYLPSYVSEGMTPRQMKRLTHLEAFDFDITASAACGYRTGCPIMLLFDYRKRDPLDYSAGIMGITGIIGITDIAGTTGINEISDITKDQ